MRRPEQTIAYRVYRNGTDLLGIAQVEMPQICTVPHYNGMEVMSSLKEKLRDKYTTQVRPHDAGSPSGNPE